MPPLQFGVPVGPEAVILALIVLWLVVPIGVAYWIYADATARSEEYAVLWALAAGVLTYTTGFGGVIVIAVYVWQRE
ncbi:hypothetical protein SAMN05192561_1011099 [Halopenitus malekzadehii]|uniref:Uncharacterized protein n=1 Tax=Halopenitus malekzadehii TaxID=1267564 RepID=A0A1H6I8E3_9EURY|nr:hypothetical protein [Halopenitus malekzadehii]SEH43952.1 hypothetical protein SAMN05192561_1011099 [Halopenitus malekzadehii]